MLAVEMTELLKPGHVLLEWRNKTLDNGELFDHRWHRYLAMPLSEAQDFLKTKALRSVFFDFRIHKTKRSTSAEPRVEPATPKS